MNLQLNLRGPLVLAALLGFMWSGVIPPTMPWMATVFSLSLLGIITATMQSKPK